MQVRLFWFSLAVSFTLVDSLPAQCTWEESFRCLAKPGWEPEITIQDLVAMKVNADVEWVQDEVGKRH